MDGQASASDKDDYVQFWLFACTTVFRMFILIMLACYENRGPSSTGATGFVLSSCNSFLSIELTMAAPFTVLSCYQEHPVQPMHYLACLVTLFPLPSPTNGSMKLA